MPFRLSNDGKNWFAHIRETSFQTDFDSFYFCFIAGITAGNKDDVPQSDTNELVDYFPDRFKTRGKLIVALFLCRELIEMGVQFKEKKAVYTAISGLIQPESPSYLSGDGMRELNKWSYGGYEVLTEWFSEKPRSLGTFLQLFKVKLDQELAKDGNKWAEGIVL